MGYPSRKSCGFTLIEMVTVMVILGVMAIGVSGFLQFGTKIFVESSERDILVSNARFAIERLSRDLRNALPNSVEFNNAGCLEYMPIVASTMYIDLPVLPESASDEIDILPTNNGNVTDATHVIVYPLSPQDLEQADQANAKMHAVDSVDDSTTPWQVSLDALVTFAVDSPSSRLFFVDEDGAVSYCVVGDELRRNNVTIIDNLANANVFSIIDASLQRHAIVTIDLTLDLASESAQLSSDSVVFSHEVHLPNAP